MRTGSVELPSASELRTMIRQESPRLARHQDYLDARPWLFAELKRIAHNAGIDTAVFDHYAVYDFDDTIAKLHRFIAQLADYLAQHVHHSEAATLYEVLAKGNPPRRQMSCWYLARQRIGELPLQWGCIMLVLLPK